MYYSFREIDGYNLPLNIILSRRGLGKTFGCVMKAIKRNVFNSERFIYVVENKEMVKTLSQNRGEKFFSAIIKYLENNNSNTNNKVYDGMYSNGKESTEIVEEDVLNKIVGGAIKINGNTAGYIIALSDFANLKRNNFVDIGTIIIDEFIPENVDIRTLQNPRKLVSIIQSVCRLESIRIYMLANSIRLDDPILVRLGLDNIKAGERRILSLDGVKYGICQYVHNDEYKQYAAASDNSIAGILARALGEDNLDKNEFRTALPNHLLIPDKMQASHLFICLHGAAGSVRLNTTKDHKYIYVINDYGTNTKNRITLFEKYVAPAVKYLPQYKDLLTVKLNNGSILFESTTVYNMFMLNMGFTI